jgi:lantibiotic modifying enzyme
LRQDLDAALDTTQRTRSQNVDHVCCGNFGRFDILLHAARVLGCSDLAAEARAQALDVRPGSRAFRVFPTDVPEFSSPGFFDGLAGIGYILLRLAAPDDLPCVLAWE